MLFRIFNNDLFLRKLSSEICNFTDDNTTYSCGKDLNEIVANLEIDFSRLLKWFAGNSIGCKIQKIPADVSSIDYTKKIAS